MDIRSLYEYMLELRKENRMIVTQEETGNYEISDVRGRGILISKLLNYRGTIL
jgi:hypothetical protein